MGMIELALLLVSQQQLLFGKHRWDGRQFLCEGTHLKQSYTSACAAGISSALQRQQQNVPWSSKRLQVGLWALLSKKIKVLM